jgi:hypothetical protein
MIVPKKWKFTLPKGGDYYYYKIVVNEEAQTTKADEAANILNLVLYQPCHPSSKNDENVKKVRLPHTIYKVICILDEAIAGKMNCLEAIMKADDLLQNDSTSRYRTYYDYRKKFDLFAYKFIQAFLDTIDSEIESVSQRKLPPHNNAMLLEDEEYISKLKTMKNFITKLANIDHYAKHRQYAGFYLNVIRQVISQFKDFDIEEFSKGKLAFLKTTKYINEKIMPFYSALQESKQLKTQNTKLKTKNTISKSEATQDLSIIFTALKTNFSSIEFNLNKFGENIVTIPGCDGKINLTQILKHEPQFMFSSTKKELDFIFEILKDNPLIISQFRIYWKKMTVDECKKELESICISEVGENLFSQCHPAHCICINFYTSDLYLYMNKLLRTGTFPEDFFATPSDDQEVQLVMDRLEEALRGSKTGEMLSSDEINLLTKWICLIIIVATDGLRLAKHVSYDPSKPFEGARTVKGQSGEYVDNLKNQNTMAYIGKTLQYVSCFQSTTFNPKIVEAFMKQPKKMLSKITAYDIFTPNNTGFGARISMYSQYKKEEELVYSPGHLVLVIPERDIKHPERYNISYDKKTSMIITDGVSPKSLFYSSQIQQLRIELIEMYEDINFNFLLIAKTHDKNLDTIQNILLECIHITETQFRPIDIMISVDKTSLNDIQALHKQSDITYVFTQTGELYCIDRSCHLIERLKISPDDFNQALELLNLTDRLQTVTDFELTHYRVNLIELNYLIKVGCQTHNIEKQYSVLQSLDIILVCLNNIENAYDQLPVNDKNSLSSFDNILQRVEKTVSRFTEEALPPVPVATAPPPLPPFSYNKKT